MTAPRHVFLDPDGTIGPWSYVIVSATTRIVYEQLGRPDVITVRRGQRGQPVEDAREREVAAR